MINVKQTLIELDLKPSKRKGQNFLLDPALAERIVTWSGITSQQAVVEVGPGLGVLTEVIAARAEKFCVIELEEKFCRYLSVKFSSGKQSGLMPKLILNRDVLGVKASEIVDLLDVASFDIVSNVPYSISTDLLFWILGKRQYIDTASLLLQREYAERLAAESGSRSYGITSVLRAMYASAELGPVIPGTAFHPRANVDSILIKLKLFKQPAVAVTDELLFKRVVKAAFGQRRKMLRNSLTTAKFLDSKEATEEVMTSAGIDPMRRAETLTLEEFAELSNKFAGAMAGD